MKHWAYLLLFYLPNLLIAQSELKVGSNDFYFEFQDRRYAGFLDIPAGEMKGIILLIPGSGKTDFLGEGGFARFFQQKRDSFLSLGFGVCAWDKHGCGQSEGTFQDDLSIEDSAEEAKAAIAALQKSQVPGIDRLGLWGISRGGWVCPIIISEVPSVAFWISVSGTSQYDNFRYLLATNFRIEGESPARISVLLKEWDFHINALYNDTISYAEYVKGTNNLYAADFYRKLSPQLLDSITFKQIQAELKQSPSLFDPDMGLRIMVPNFQQYLTKVNIPVLAILGEKDSQIDWKRTKTLYQQTMGKQSQAKLKIISLSNCNHLMMECKTGAMFEDLKIFDYRLCPDYYPSMKNWLSRLQFED